MHFRVAIITTGEEDEAFALVQSDGIIENNIKLFQKSLKVGVSGSGIETAIYNIEQALQSKKYGNKHDGILTELDMPRMNEKLFIIILSDEASNYEERAEKKFDIENNLIVNRDHKVCLIGSPAKNYYDWESFKHIIDAYGVYGALAKKTGGLVQDINHIHNYDSITTIR